MNLITATAGIIKDFLRLLWGQKMRRTVLAAIVITTSIGTTYAQDHYSPVPLGWVTFFQSPTIQLALIDEVSGGCWTNTQGARDAAQLELLRSDFRIADIAPVRLEIFALGYATSDDPNFCAVYVDVSLWSLTFDNRTAGGYTLGGPPSWLLLYHPTVVMTGPRSNMTSRINETILGYVRRMLVRAYEELDAITFFLENTVGGVEATFWLDWIATGRAR